MPRRSLPSAAKNDKGVKSLLTDRTVVFIKIFLFTKNGAIESDKRKDLENLSLKKLLKRRIFLTRIVSFFIELKFEKRFLRHCIFRFSDLINHPLEQDQNQKKLFPTILLKTQGELKNEDYN